MNARYLVEGRDGSLYWADQIGAQFGNGTVFKLNANRVTAGMSAADEPDGSCVTLTGANSTEAVAVVFTALQPASR